MSEKLMVCKALAAMLHDKGEVTEEGVSFVAHAAFELALSLGENQEVQGVLKNGGDYAGAIATIESRPMRTFLFRRVVAAVLLDEEIDEDEQEIIDRTAEAFGYSSELRDDFVAWMQAGIEWEKKGVDLMNQM